MRSFTRSALLLACLAAGARGGDLPPAADGSAAAIVTTATTGVTLHLMGDLAPRISVKVYSRVSGLVTRIHFHEGSRFEAGQIMAEIDDAEHRMAVREARARLESAQARLAAMEAGGRPQERVRAAAEVTATMAVHQHALRNRDRFEGLASRGAISKQALEDVSREAAVASARLVSAQNSLALVEEGPRPEDKRVARADLERARVELDQALLRLSYTRIVAPFSGTVTQRLADEGSYVLAASSPQASPLAVLAQSQVLRAVVDIPEKDLFRVRLGQPASVLVQPFPGRPFAGTVINLYPNVDRATRMAKLEVEIPNEPPLLVPGMFAEVVLVGAARPARSMLEVLQGRSPGRGAAGDSVPIATGDAAPSPQPPHPAVAPR